MRIHKISEDTFKVEVQEKEHILDLSNAKSFVSEFVDFFRQLAKVQGMGMNSQEFLATIEEEDIFKIYEVLHTTPEAAKEFTIFNDADSEWNNEYAENIVRGQRLVSLSEEDYEYVQLLKCKVDPRWLKQTSIKHIRKVTDEEKQPLGKEDDPILPKENSHAGYVH